MDAGVILLQEGAGKPPAQDYNQAAAFITALTGQDASTAVVDVRALHDTDKNHPGIPLRGTLPQLWQQIIAYQSQGFGAFINVSEMDGVGRERANVANCRVQMIDLDNLSAEQNYQRAVQWTPAPSFAVQSSPGRFHVYWRIEPHRDLDRFTLLQRKLRQQFDGDPKISDPTRVLRLPGTLHLKDPNKPALVTCWQLGGFGQRYAPEALEMALASVNVIDSGSGVRHELGDPALAAPSIEALKEALKLIDPNKLGRGDWVAALAAAKQAAWTHTTPDEIDAMLMAWCARYEQDDPGEDRKQITSIRNTEVGYSSIHWKAYGKPPQPDPAKLLGPNGNAITPDPNATPLPFGELLTAQEQQTWFAGCVLIGPKNRIIGPRGIRYDTGSFNASFGGKKFIIDNQGKVTDEAWKAATRSTLWTVPKVDGTCFRPDQQTNAIVHDGLGRSYVNTYVPAKIEALEGDVSPFLRHLALILPNENDQRILLEYIAHNVRYPGHKLFLAPLIQSVEGVGKNVFKQILLHSIDKQYFYQPKAKQLNESGSKFNGWMDSKLFFLVDEIKTDDKRDMVETLKPFITETSLEIEGKGDNQIMGDTPGNWMFFSNHKDAIPIHKSGRRFAIFYSAVQTVDDLQSRGMDDAYFNSLYGWLGDDQNGGHKMGLKIVANYLSNYPIERGAVAKRAPMTTSTAEALIESRGWLGQLIAEAVEDGASGFRGGWVSTAAVGRLLSRRGYKPVPPATLGKAITELGYHRIGQAGRAYLQDDPEKRGVLWNLNPAANNGNYGQAQGYE